MGLFKRQSFLPEDCENNLKISIDCSTAEQTEGSEHSENLSEHIESPVFPSKELPVPLNADEHIFNLRMRYYPSIS